MSRHRIILAVFLLVASSTIAIAQSYQAQLDPAPFDATTRANVIGSIGQANATLDGDTLSVTGKFSGLTSPAMAAQLRTGPAKGVPGDAIGSLTVSHSRDGVVSGIVKLTAAQLAALNKQSIYVRVDSEKAPDGNLQGWLEPAGEGND
jgi:hypothetical protein